MKVILQYQGGSHLYALNTEHSDIDIRGITLHTDIPHILGLQSHERETQVSKQGLYDIVFRELRHFLQLCKRGNPESIETLFIDIKYPLLTVTGEWFDEVVPHRLKLIDSEAFHKALLGYVQNEIKLATGQRQGILGSKRREAVATFGFSPKNFVQALRLLSAGIVFFTEGYFPLSFRNINPHFHELLFDIKTHPEKHNVKDLTDLLLELANKLKSLNRIVQTFDETVANNILRTLYGKYL